MPTHFEIEQTLMTLAYPHGEGSDRASLLVAAAVSVAWACAAVLVLW